MTSDTPLWAREIKKKDDIPDKFIGHIDPYILSNETLPIMIHMPEHPNEDNISLDKIIYIFSNNIHLIREINVGEIRTTTLQIKDIFSIEHGKILLYSWLRLKTFSLEEDVFMDFNTVMEPLFKEFINIIRTSNNHTKLENINSEHSFDKNSFDYKFQNYVKDSLDEEMTIHHMLFQDTFKSDDDDEEIYNHATLLTECEIINIKETPDKENPSKFCTIWNFIPLINIEKIDIKDYNDKNYISLEIASREINHTFGLFEAQNKDSLYNIINLFRLFPK